MPLDNAAAMPMPFRSVKHDLEKSSPWFVSTCSRPEANVRLFCFPFAGGGSSVFSTWKGQLDNVDIKAVQLPGRESRFRDTPISDFNVLMPLLIEAIEGYLDKPFVFFGHSLGGLIAFELARHLRDRSLALPEHLIISGKQALGVTPRRKPICNLPDEEFIIELEKYAGTPKEILASKELMQLLLPMLRADVTLFDLYKKRDPQPPLSCPITVLGADDDPFVATEDLPGWKSQTSSDFDLRILSGDHFLLTVIKMK